MYAKEKTNITVKAIHLSKSTTSENNYKNTFN